MYLALILFIYVKLYMVVTYMYTYANLYVYSSVYKHVHIIYAIMSPMKIQLFSSKAHSKGNCALAVGITSISLSLPLSLLYFTIIFYLLLTLFLNENTNIPNSNFRE
jgi:hypothetical protein